MGDLISRQEAIDALNRLCPYPGEWSVYGLDLCKDAIANLPSIDAKPQWTPCSERLPEENEVVLTQARFADDIKMAVSARIDYNYWTGWGTREVNVVAWMPLPEPYEVERKEE